MFLEFIQMIINNFKNRFEHMKRSGQHIQFVLDIGAYRGEFTETVLSVWPSAIVTQIEADERQQSWLKPSAIIALLGDQIKDNVDFYTLDEDQITTGSSIFREFTVFYNNTSVRILKKQMSTLDELYKTHKFIGNWQDHGLIKMDTQGSELLILEGAKAFLAEKCPRFILFETSVVEYNKGAPTIAECMSYMSNIGYKMIDVFDLSYGDRNQLLQVDILWERS